MIPLTLAQHNQLIEILVQYAPLHTEQGRINFLEAAGLAKVHAETRPGISKSDYCRELVRTLNQPTSVMDDGTHVFPRFLRYVQQEVVAGHPDLVGFIDTLFLSSVVVGNADTLAVYESRMPIPDLFVGRKKLLAEIWKRLGKIRERNLLTLWGIGGVGKSALAVQVMNDEKIVPLFPDGRYWLDLRGGDAAAAIRGLLVRDFGMGDVQLPSALNEVVALLHGQVRGKKVLLVMDNAESLAPTPAEIRNVVRNLVLPLPGMTLVTSRVEIDRPHDVEVDILETGDGVELLAKSLGWNKTERERETGDAQKLVTYLEGLALALRITASRMSRRQQTCATALAALQKAPMLDIASAEGEKTLRQTFALSYKDLQEPFRTLFHFLGVCAVGGARVAALAEMLEWSEEDVETSMDGLVERSLAERTATRVELHPLLHQFALEYAQSEVAYPNWVLWHFTYYGEKVGSSLRNVIVQELDMNLALNLLDSSIENVRLAQIRALGPYFINKELAVEVTVNLLQYWELREEPELFNWLQNALVIARQTGQKQRQANLLQSIGHTWALSGDNDTALKSYDGALELYEAIKDRLGQANVLLLIGNVQAFRKEKEAALVSYKEALKLSKTVGNRLGQANALQAIGNIHSFYDEEDAALASHTEALELFKAVGNRLGQANALLALAQLKREISLFEEAIQFYESISAIRSIARAKIHFAIYFILQHEFERARTLLLEAGWGSVPYQIESGVAIPNIILKQLGGDDSEGAEVP